VSDELVTIATAGSAVEAEMLKGQLEAEGIPAFIIGEHTHGLHLRGLDPLDAGIRIQVPAAAVDDALTVLNDDDGEPAEGAGSLELDPGLLAEMAAGDDVESDGPFCAQCGSDLICFEPRSGLTYMLAIPLLGLPLLFMRRRLQCRSCGRYVDRAG